jgi:broad specificity phosphatase PhoE
MTSGKESDVTRLYLIRHGATDANERVPYILQGNAIDLPLSREGEAQARAVAEFLRQFPIRQVYHSSMVRARQTAATIARELGVAATIAPDLQECNVGVWEGLDWETIRTRYPEEHRRFVENPADSAYLGGESYRDVLRRVRPVMERLLDENGGQAIAVVAHNVVNRAILADLMGLDLRLAPKIAQGNGCVNLIHRRGGHVELVTLNSLFHIGSLTAAAGRGGSSSRGD